MIAINDIRQIARQMQSCGMGNIEINGKGFSLRLRCDDERGFNGHQRTENLPPVAIKALKKGQFWATHPMQEKPAVECGTQVKAGDCLGFLQLGDLMMPIRSPQDGEVIDIKAVQGEQVGRGRVLFSIKPQLSSSLLEEASDAFY
ncbi:acetyl-CoA carboxylase biotin carboxyl carrier protein subunit [Rouxiella sp. T17]|uniref:acetyl-CoA carboxylase biotin carboxyl carrier protein subunit n=1 Tax=Rouxiella sp. T17 TaxID=3085684 RepID=UPI002FCA3C1B